MSRATINDNEIIEQFSLAMAAQGIVVTETIKADGKLHRYHAEGDKGGSRNAWAVLHLEGKKPAGAFGCNRRWGADVKFTWSGKQAKPLSLEERRAWAKKMAGQKAEREAEERERRQAAADHARFMWDQAQECTEHPYLTRKGVKSHGLRVGPWEKIDLENGTVDVLSEQALLIPIRDVKKNIHSLQAIFVGNIYGDRDKDFVKHGVKAGLFYSFGKPQTVEVDGEQRQVILIGEGYATLASAHEATGHACIVAFDAGNLPAVVKIVRGRFPDAVLVLLADNDQWTKTPVNNPGVTKAIEAAKAVGGLVAVPPFSHYEGEQGSDGKMSGPTDFNDWHQRFDLDAVRALIEAALEDGARPARVVLVPTEEEVRNVAYAQDCLERMAQKVAKCAGCEPCEEDDTIFLAADGDLERVAAIARMVYPEATINILAAPGQADEVSRVAAKCGASVSMPPSAHGWRGWGEHFLELLFDRIDQCVKGAQTAGIGSGKLPAASLPYDTSLVIPQQNQAPENSDDALALQFVECAVDFRWSPGLGWMIDNGVTWSRDDAMNRFDLARKVCRAVAATCSEKSESEARRIASAKTVNATVTLAQSDRRMVVPTSAWDADLLLLNTPGGVVDLRTGKMRNRGIDYVTQTTAVAPDFSEDCPTWRRFLQQVFLGDADMIEFMQRSMGYWLSGSVREQVIHFLHGQGSNGKSVLSDLVRRIVGGYGVKLTATALMQSKGERHPTELAQLRGKRLALSSELGENDFFNEALLKELTGDATLSARFMRGDFFEFQMSQKHLIVGNFKPRLRGGDPAIARRMLLVPFNATFKGAAKDMGLPDKLKAEEPAILAWMIQGATKWYAEGLAIPNSVREASADYMADHDDVAQWISECCELEGEARASDLYANFSNWKRARGENPPSQTTWGSRLTALPGISKRRSGGIRYSGIRLTVAQFGRHSDIGSYGDIRD